MVSRKSWAHGALFAVGLLIVPVPRVARCQSPASSSAANVSAEDVENAKARQTFKEGIAAFDRRDFEAARVAFLQTFALKPTAPVVRRNLGLAEIYSGHYLEGARRLGRVIHTTDEGSSVDRARMVESLKKAEAHLERVTVEVNVEGAEIQIGDVDLGTSPLPFAWYLEPGSYDVRVNKPGFEPYSETRVARAGNAQHLRIGLKPIEIAAPIPVAPASEPVPLPRPEIDRGGPNPWVLVAGSVVTAGGLAAGLTLSLFAADNADKVRQLGDELAGTDCRGTDDAQCQQLSDRAAAHDQQVRWAAVSFAVGAAAGISTLVYALLTSADGGHHAGSSAALPFIDPRSFGVSVAGGRSQLVFNGSF
jgi:PEGA domain-containing protein